MLSASRYSESLIHMDYLLAIKLDLGAIVGCLRDLCERPLPHRIGNSCAGARPPSMFFVRLDQRSAQYVMDFPYIFDRHCDSSHLPTFGVPVFLPPLSLHCVLTVRIAYSPPGTHLSSTLTPTLRGTPWENQPSTKKRASNEHPSFCLQPFADRLFCFQFGRCNSQGIGSPLFAQPRNRQQRPRRILQQFPTGS